jgi:putative flavoprotein involved in K+ transport
MTTVNTVIIGGGHGGLNLACWIAKTKPELTQVVLERDVTFCKWKKNRWDGFMLNTPQKWSRLYGQQDDVPDTEMGRPIADDVQRWEAHVKALNIDVRDHCKVVGVTRDAASGVFTTTVECADGGVAEYKSLNVVAASGEYDHVCRPSFADKVHPSIRQVTSDQYKGPAELNDGGVLVVGSGQTGIQLSKLLVDAGRKVSLATSKVAGSVRSYRGEDVFAWMERIGFLGMPTAALAGLPPPVAAAMRYGSAPITGPNSAISYFSLARDGVTILGHVSGVSDDEGLVFGVDGTRSENINIALGPYNQLPGMIEEWIVANGKQEEYGELKGFPEPEWAPVPELLDSPGPDTVAFQSEGITNIIWATGWAHDLSYIKIDGVAAGFDPVKHTPVELCSTVAAGLFFTGYPWLTHLQSVNLVGMDRDHAVIVDNLRT